ncbi:hypothetical protein, partial [Actinoplanes sp. TFC3]|uniref:hypothetical protein n=1 Tax=Actinoplanes sp. TFC3 TaxID=1710355 RepID=UPI001F462946
SGALSRPWQPPPTQAPPLFGAPEDCIAGDPQVPPIPGEWRAQWPLPHTRVSVPGDHCTIVAEHAAEAAAAIHTWLDQAPNEGQS